MSPRPVWTPDDDDRRVLEQLADAAAAADEAEDAMWALAAAAKARRIPPARIAAVVRRGRATVYRRLDELAGDPADAHD